MPATTGDASNNGTNETVADDRAITMPATTNDQQRAMPDDARAMAITTRDEPLTMATTGDGATTGDVSNQ